MENKFLLNRIATQLTRIANSLEKKNMSNDEEIAQIKSSISGFANEASENELSALLEIAAFANTEYNRKIVQVAHKQRMDSEHEVRVFVQRANEGFVDNMSLMDALKHIEDTDDVEIHIKKESK